MEMKFSKEDAIKFIEEYYKKIEHREVSAKIKSEKGTSGYQTGEFEVCNTRIIIEEDIEVMGIKTKTTEKIPEKNLLGIFKTILEEYGYDVTSAKFDDGINKVWEGSYMCEHQVPRVYCKGIILNVKKDVKQKKIGGK